jgi:hypothetical protein
LPLLYVNLATLANRKAVLRARRGNPPDMRKSIRSSLVVAEEALMGLRRLRLTELDPGAGFKEPCAMQARAESRVGRVPYTRKPAHRGSAPAL